MYVNTGKQTNLIDSNKKGKSHIYFMYKRILQHIHYTYVTSTYIAMYVHTHITEYFTFSCSRFSLSFFSVLDMCSFSFFNSCSILFTSNFNLFIVTSFSFRVLSNCFIVSSLRFCNSSLCLLASCKIKTKETIMFLKEKSKKESGPLSYTCTSSKLCTSSIHIYVYTNTIQ